jgi:hypothetical protein
MICTFTQPAVPGLHFPAAALTLLQSSGSMAIGESLSIDVYRHIAYKSTTKQQYSFRRWQIDASQPAGD